MKLPGKRKLNNKCSDEIKCIGQKVQIKQNSAVNRHTAITVQNWTKNKNKKV